MEVVMEANDAALYQRLYVSEADLAESSKYAKHILEKGWHGPSFMRLQSVPMQQDAFTSAMIVAYGRACKPSRRPIYPPVGVLDFSDQQNVLHNTLVHLRDKVIAHSDADMRAGSVCLNSSGRFVKWISASIMPPPSLVPAR